MYIKMNSGEVIGYYNEEEKFIVIKERHATRTKKKYPQIKKILLMPNDTPTSVLQDTKFKG